MCECNALKAYRKRCSEICASVAKEPTDLKLVFDLETTGLNPDKDEILEAAIVTTDGEILFESRFKPETIAEWPGAQNVNGISPKDVEDAPGLIDKIGEMATLLQNAETIVAYNGKQFDIPFLAKYGVHLREDAVIDDPMLYGAVVYGELRGEGENTSYKWQKLSVLAEHFGYKDAGWHNAAADCIATAYVWHKLQELEMVKRYNDNLAALNDFAVNKTRREELTKFHDTVFEVKKQLAMLYYEEEEYMDNIPENLQCSERYVRAEKAADALDSAMSSLEDALDYIETACAWHKLQEPEVVEQYNTNLDALNKNETLENNKDSQKISSVSDFAARYREGEDQSSEREL